MAAEQDAAAQTGGSDPSTAYALTPLAGTRSESAPATYAVGDTVTVLYFESRPRDSARIDPGIWYWARVALVALAGGIATMFGVNILRGRSGK